ncbi:unnamed protein product [Calicophoron daubneyi]|uniref:Tropomyosin n=1 Tax=Calicophoron daubneyi TaxID=300641 RepID=A0AAV2TXW8_CALDB
MAAAADLRSRLVSLFEDYKKIGREVEGKNEELAQCMADRKKLEGTRTKTFAELDMAERKKADMERKIKENLRKISELQKSTAECQKTSESLSRKLETQDETLEGLQKKVTAAQEEAAAAARTYTEAIDRLRDVQNSRDQVEKREEQLIRSIKELEEENAFVNSKIRHMKVVNSQAEQRTDALEKAIAELSEKLNSANQRTADAESTYEDLGVQLCMLEEEANDLQLRGQKLQKQIDIMQSTIQEA